MQAIAPLQRPPTRHFPRVSLTRPSPHPHARRPVFPCQPATPTPWPAAAAAAGHNPGSPCCVHAATELTDTMLRGLLLALLVGAAAAQGGLRLDCRDSELHVPGAMRS